MPCLVVNPGTPESWQIELEPGTLLLGRGQENDYPIEHPSVSHSHCRITVSDSGVWIQDLGSTSGTFIDDELVEEAQLKQGQVVRLGEIAMRFESDEVQAEPAAAGPPVAPRLTESPPPVSARSAFCKFHPQIPGRFACPQCGRNVCELCVTTRLVEGEARKFCRACGTECEAVQASVPAAAAPPGFYASLPRALAYPFRGSGVILLAAGTAFFFLLGRLPFLGFIVAGYLFNYAKSIITTTAGGRDEPPDWPEFTDWIEGFILPYLQFLALTVLTFGPFYVLGLWRPGTETQARLVALAALGYGALLAPMGMLALAMFDTVAALNPIALTASIARIPIPYLAAAAAFEVVLALHSFAEGALGRWIPVPLLPSLISSFLYLYLVTVGMRILGLLYVTHRQQLGWFRHSA